METLKLGSWALVMMNREMEKDMTSHKIHTQYLCKKKNQQVTNAAPTKMPGRNFAIKSLSALKAKLSDQTTP